MQNDIHIRSKNKIPTRWLGYRCGTVGIAGGVGAGVSAMGTYSFYGGSDNIYDIISLLSGLIQGIL